MSSALLMSETESRVRSHTCSAVWPTFSIRCPNFLFPSPAERPFGGLSARVSTMSPSPSPAGDFADEVAERDRADQTLPRVFLDERHGGRVQRLELPFRLVDLRPHALADLARRLFDFFGHLHDLTSCSNPGPRLADSPTENRASRPPPEKPRVAAPSSPANPSAARSRRATP